MIIDPSINSAIVNNIEKFVEHANKLNTELVSIGFNDIDTETYQLDKNILTYAQRNIANIANNFSLLRNNVLVLTDLTIARDKAIKFIMDNKEYYPNIDTSINVINTIAESVFYHNNDRLYIEAKIATTSIEAKYTIDLNRINKLKEEKANKDKAIELLKAFSELSPILNDSAKKVIAGEIVSVITELKDNKNSDYEAVLAVLKNSPVTTEKVEEQKIVMVVQYPTLNTFEEKRKYGKTIIERVWNYINKHPGVARWKLYTLMQENEQTITNYVSILARRVSLRVNYINDTAVLFTIGDKYYTERESEKIKQNKRAVFKIV